MIKGSCHCGAIAYTLDGEATEAVECNCSICRRKGSVLAFFPPERFTLETPREALTAYTFRNHVIQHQFCKICGCAPFSEGVGPNGPMIAVNLRCAEGIDFSRIRITAFDGASM